MKKKTYISPTATVVTVETAQVIAYSGGGDVFTVISEADDGDEDNRARRMGCSAWDDNWNFGW